ncbi:hypothetical protein GT347_15840 [Xylophilus rhododendri]|uniref:Uncharacterized protein n=1 Tax=Xylophilus rhododendri TaxID=2697032 RepID=A0A857J9A1_9BURK|nr:hypothetical protein [Xylophilus rhododendri]QHI99318.1 hypothetical protein GT347_15840 [Xylophilus rhododendri]
MHVTATTTTTTTTVASQTASTSASAPPLRYEELPEEMLLEVAHWSLRWMLDHPQADGVTPLADCNQRLGRALAEPAAAAAAISALWASKSVAQARMAIDALEHVSPHHTAECWEAAWRALKTRALRPPPRPDVEILFFHMLDRLPEDPQQRLRQMRRAVAFSYKQSRFTSEWRLAPIAKLLRHCAQLPVLPDSMWRCLLKMLADKLCAENLETGRQLAWTAGLSPQRQQQLTLLLDCLDGLPGPMTPQRMRALLGPVEQIADPAIRLTLLWCLQRRAVACAEPSEALNAAEAELHRALLRIRDAALRPKVLENLPFLQYLVPQNTLLAELAALTPLAALEVIASQTHAFGRDSDGIALLGRCLDETMQRSRELPDGHPAFLCAMGKDLRHLRDQALHARIAGLVLEDSRALGAAQRLDVLAALDRLEWRDIDLQDRWQAEWTAAVAAAHHALRQATTGAAAWPLLLALVPALTKPDQHDAALQAQLEALPLLHPHDAARHLHTICIECMLSPVNKAGMQEDQLIQLIEAGRCLPSYLRRDSIPLLNFMLLPGDEAAVSQARMKALAEETEQEHRAWVALHAPGLALTARATDDTGD